MDNEEIESFHAYSGAGDQRNIGAGEAAKFGAVGTIVRSLNLRLDDFPHQVHKIMAQKIAIHSYSSYKH
jgi:hypothetical protein